MFFFYNGIYGILMSPQHTVQLPLNYHRTLCDLLNWDKTQGPGGNLSTLINYMLAFSHLTHEKAEPTDVHSSIPVSLFRPVVALRHLPESGRESFSVSLGNFDKLICFILQAVLIRFFLFFFFFLFFLMDCHD